MREPHIVVCMKVVPKAEEIQVDPETLLLKREGARSEINPPDMNALEVALRLKDAHGAHVSLLSMGPPFFEPILRMALAMGADDLYLLSDRAFAGADTLATTYTLARGIEKATGQVPAGIAAWLDLPQVTLINSLEFEHNSARPPARGGFHQDRRQRTSFHGFPAQALGDGAGRGGRLGSGQHRCGPGLYRSSGLAYSRCRPA